MPSIHKQNSPFCDVKRAVLKNAMEEASVLFGFITVGSTILHLKRQKISAVFSSHFY